MQDLLNFGLAEWSALFYVFFISKFSQEVSDPAVGSVLLDITGSFSVGGGWRGCMEGLFYLGQFLLFLFFLAITSVIATLVLLPHWLMCDYFGYPYRLQTVAIYAGVIWSFGHLANGSNKQIQALKEEVKLWRKMAIDYEKQIEISIKETKK